MGKLTNLLRMVSPVGPKTPPWVCHLPMKEARKFIGIRYPRIRQKKKHEFHALFLGATKN